MEKCKDCEHFVKGGINECILDKCDKVEMVDHPNHYAENSIECIDALVAARGAEEVKAFCICNAIKYLWRLGKKDDKIQEAKKAQWYINKYIELTEEQYGN